MFGYRDLENPAEDGELGLESGAKNEAMIEQRKRIIYFNGRERERKQA